MPRSLNKLVLIALVGLSLNACGFVTAPVTQTMAYAGKGTVKTVDTGIVYGKVAIKKSKDAAIYVREEAVEGFKPVQPGSATRGSIRRR